MGSGRELDGLARDLASGEISRRSALKRLAGGAVAASVASLPGAEALASRSRRCPPARKCGDRCCPAHSKCRRGKCKCNEGYDKCGRKCVDMQTSVKHCGDCDTVCPEGSSCVEGFCTAPPGCGDGIVQAELGETCDDGNFFDGDGCSSTCQVEAGFQCVGEPSVCSPICGDGMIVGGEVCDGNDLGGQTCVTQGYSGGDLACSNDCLSFDHSGCTL